MTARLVIFAPNWLGDAVMALPALADVRQHFTDAAIEVAARSSIAPLFSMVPGINRVVTLEKAGGAADQLRRAGYDVALLLPNSFNVARIAWRAGVRERWGYRTDFRALLLTKSVPAPTRVHQTEYYRH